MKDTLWKTFRNHDRKAMEEYTWTDGHRRKQVAANCEMCCHPWQKSAKLSKQHTLKDK